MSALGQLIDRIRVEARDVLFAMRSHIARNCPRQQGKEQGKEQVEASAVIEEVLPQLYGRTNAGVWCRCHPGDGYAQYAVLGEHQSEYEAELDRWVADGWLKLHNPEVHGVDGVIPLVAASQPNKPKKVRPVMDYHELNSYIESKLGQDTAVCQEKLREWRRQGTVASLLDLRKAYLQVHVSKNAAVSD